MKRRNGDYSCQLVFSRSKIIPKDMTQPRAELIGALLNTHTGEVVRRSFHKWHKSSIKLTDSQIVLHWINNDEKPLKQWIRNRVIEILRYTSVNQWYYVHSKDMIADIGTRRGASLEDVNQSSKWINGFQWMKLDVSQFPMKSVQDLHLSNSEIQEIEKEVPYIKVEAHSVNTLDNASDEIMKRYVYSKYLIDPNRHSFNVVVRIMAYVMKFCKILLKRNSIKDSADHSRSSNFDVKNSVQLSEAEIAQGEMYFFKKCTAEIKHFLSPKKYERISTERDGILVYTGRILPTQDVTVVGNFTNVMKDLKGSTFCVPMVDKHSPVAYSIVSDVHWNDKVVNHCGIETISRYVLRKAYIIEGRSVIKSVKKSCERCRYLLKKSIEVAMGPVSDYNLIIAPAFYVSQVDLSGPYKAFSPHQKRTTIKIWLVVFCCCTTSSTKILVMDDYGTTAFIQAFIRLSCMVGFPKTLLCDPGSQLVKGCGEMKLQFNNIKHKLHHDVAVDFEVCPVGGHNMHGKVERKIREINASLEKTVKNERLSIMQWETVAAQVANSINDLPLALGNIVADFDNLDLITPNRLCLGRNNSRSPTGDVVIVDNPDKLLKENARIFNAWFDNWLLSHVPKLLSQQKWFDSEKQPKKGDVVLFLKQESSISNTYQYGMVEDVEQSKDGLARKLRVRYRNVNESVDRYTTRSTRSLVLIHHVDETNITKELGDIAIAADIKLRHHVTKQD